MSEKIKPAEGGKVKRKLWSKENGVTQDQVNSTIIFIDELQVLFEKHGLEFIYPELCPNDESINVFWDKKNKTFMDIWIKPNTETILVNIDSFPLNNYNEHINRNNIPNSLFEFLKKDSEKKSGYFKALSD